MILFIKNKILLKDSRVKLEIFIFLSINYLVGRFVRNIFLSKGLLVVKSSQIGLVLVGLVDWFGLVL